MIGFAPNQNLYDYIAEVERRRPIPLSPELRDWAATSRLGGIPAPRFAGWLALTDPPPSGHETTDPAALPAAGPPSAPRYPAPLSGRE